MGSYSSLNDRRISPDAAKAALHARRFYDTAWVAFQDDIPIGTVVTIVAPAPKRWGAADNYLIRLHPDLSRGLQVELSLDRGLEGQLNGLNPEKFERVE